MKIKIISKKQQIKEAVDPISMILAFIAGLILGGLSLATIAIGRRNAPLYTKLKTDVEEATKKSLQPSAEKDPAAAKELEKRIVEVILKPTNSVLTKAAADKAPDAVADNSAVSKRVASVATESTTTSVKAVSVYPDGTVEAITNDQFVKGQASGTIPLDPPVLGSGAIEVTDKPVVVVLPEEITGTIETITKLSSDTTVGGDKPTNEEIKNTSATADSTDVAAAITVDPSITKVLEPKAVQEAQPVVALDQLASTSTGKTLQQLIEDGTIKKTIEEVNKTKDKYIPQDIGKVISKAYTDFIKKHRLSVKGGGTPVYLYKRDPNAYDLGATLIQFDIAKKFVNDFDTLLPNLDGQVRTFLLNLAYGNLNADIFLGTSLIKKSENESPSRIALLDYFTKNSINNPSTDVAFGKKFYVRSDEDLKIGRAKLNLLLREVNYDDFFKYYEPILNHINSLQNKVIPKTPDDQLNYNPADANFIRKLINKYKNFYNKLRDEGKDEKISQTEVFKLFSQDKSADFKDLLLTKDDGKNKDRLSTYKKYTDQMLQGLLASVEEERKQKATQPQKPTAVTPTPTAAPVVPVPAAPAAPATAPAAAPPVAPPVAPTTPATKPTGPKPTAAPAPAPAANVQTPAAPLPPEEDPNLPKTSPPAEPEAPSASTSSSSVDPNSVGGKRKKMSSYSDKEKKEILNKPYQEINKLVLPQAQGNTNKRLFNKEAEYIDTILAGNEDVYTVNDSGNDIVDLNTLSENIEEAISLFDTTSEKGINSLIYSSNYVNVMKGVFKKSKNVSTKHSEAIQKTFAIFISDSSYITPKSYKQFLEAATDDTVISEVEETNDVQDSNEQKSENNHKTFIEILEVIQKEIEDIEESQIELNSIDVNKIEQDWEKEQKRMAAASSQDTKNKKQQKLSNIFPLPLENQKLPQDTIENINIDFNLNLQNSIEIFNERVEEYKDLSEDVDEILKSAYKVAIASFDINFYKKHDKNLKILKLNKDKTISIFKLKMIEVYENAKEKLKQFKSQDVNSNPSVDTATTTSDSPDKGGEEKQKQVDTIKNRGIIRPASGESTPVQVLFLQDRIKNFSKNEEENQKLIQQLDRKIVSFGLSYYEYLDYIKQKNRKLKYYPYSDITTERKVASKYLRQSQNKIYFINEQEREVAEESEVLQKQRDIIKNYYYIFAAEFFDQTYEKFLECIKDFEMLKEYYRGQNITKIDVSHLSFIREIIGNLKADLNYEKINEIIDFDEIIGKINLKIYIEKEKSSIEKLLNLLIKEIQEIIKYFREQSIRFNKLIDDEFIDVYLKKVFEDYVAQVKKANTQWEKDKNYKQIRSNKFDSYQEKKDDNEEEGEEKEEQDPELTDEFDSEDDVKQSNQSYIDNNFLDKQDDITKDKDQDDNGEDEDFEAPEGLAQDDEENINQVTFDDAINQNSNISDEDKQDYIDGYNNIIKLFAKDQKSVNEKEVKKEFVDLINGIQDTYKNANILNILNFNDEIKILLNKIKQAQKKQSTKKQPEAPQPVQAVDKPKAVAGMTVKKKSNTQPVPKPVEPAKDDSMDDMLEEDQQLFEYLVNSLKKVEQPKPKIVTKTIKEQIEEEDPFARRMKVLAGIIK